MHFHRVWRTLFVSSLAVLAAAAAAAEVTLPSLFGDHMVIQQGKKARVWGTAAPNEPVTVKLGDRENATVADDQGLWSVRIDPPAAGGPYELTVSAPSGSRTIQDVLVGEVWVCSGQSNMQWPLSRAANPEQEVAQATDPQIRLFKVEMTVAAEPQDSVAGQWAVCAPEVAKDFSAVGYFFGRELRKELNVPVGLIQSAWGGTPAESWTTRATLESRRDFAPILERFEADMKNYPTAKAEFDQKLAEWQAAAEQAKAAGTEPPRRPGEPRGPESPWRPAGLYNAMIHPLTPFPIQGAIWYQGESNADRAEQYATLFPAMIEDWRRAWGNPDMPFLFVQLANFMERKPDPAPSAWAELREAQTKTLCLPNTAMALAIDIGDAQDIHPTNKQEVGRRLALGALKIAYGRPVEHSGPVYESMEVAGKEVRLRFAHADGLTAQGGPLKGFAVAGPDGVFTWADARIEGNEVVVSAPAVETPVAVRYAWADNPEANLYNGAGLPAVPFRTDNWPGVTTAKR